MADKKNSDKKSSGEQKFEYSEAAMEQLRASMRRNIRPTLVFAPTIVLSAILHDHQAVALLLLTVGFVVSTVMIGQNYMLQRRARLRMKAEKREWQAKQTGPR